MTFRSPFVGGVVVGLCVCAACSRVSSGEAPPSGQAASAAPATSTPARVPPHAFDLTRLQKFYVAPYAGTGKGLDEMLDLLREELGHPSAPGMGLGGGPMDSGYVQGVIIRVMAQTIPVDQLRKAVATEHDQAIRLRLTVAAGMAGDKEVAPALLALLKSDEDGFLRVASAEALAGAPDASLMDAFKTALADRYSQISVTDVGPDHGEYKVYPVRLIAASALRRLGQEVPAGTVLSTPLQGESEAQTLSLLLDDKDPEVCLSAVEMLSGRGADAVPLLRKFVLSNSVDPALAASVAEARRAVGDSNTARGD